MVENTVGHMLVGSAIILGVMAMILRDLQPRGAHRLGSLADHYFDRGMNRLAPEARS